mmetsp:Transcript_8430/g.25328  ORF Transcript_8430/g.25328 Transcript_8430/m.25328 type:complete len:266 (-) Transcript_8430:378-1175(-)
MAVPQAHRGLLPIKFVQAENARVRVRDLAGADEQLLVLVVVGQGDAGRSRRGIPLLLLNVDDVLPHSNLKAAGAHHVCEVHAKDWRDRLGEHRSLVTEALVELHFIAPAVEREAHQPLAASEGRLHRHAVLGVVPNPGLSIIVEPDGSGDDYASDRTLFASISSVYSHLLHFLHKNVLRLTKTRILHSGLHSKFSRHVRELQLGAQAWPVGPPDPVCAGLAVLPKDAANLFGHLGTPGGLRGKGKENNSPSSQSPLVFCEPLHPN